MLELPPPPPSFIGLQQPKETDSILPGWTGREAWHSARTLASALCLGPGFSSVSGCPQP